MTEQNDTMPRSWAYPETDLERTIRFMRDNVRGAYESVYPPDHASRGEFRVNSGTCVLVCCYMGALGKVLLRGGPDRGTDRRDFLRFRAFAAECMPDLASDFEGKDFPATPKGRQGAIEWLYEVFRCGFVHGFYPGRTGAWTREPKQGDYWLQHGDLVVLNIDQLVVGFQAGLQVFSKLAGDHADLQKRCLEYLLAD